ncbi:divergent polysaccharide deacetylase family protein [Kiloniella litopenaei]|uniref:divergent polysaccharide deacetylase family protein n=1 Tax=Kiloniella litopenaei TaxID=1549748 RepID=UPI003BAD6E8C
MQKRKTTKTDSMPKKAKKSRRSHYGSLFIVAGFVFFITLAVSSVLIFQKNTDNSAPPEPQTQRTEEQAKREALAAAPVNKPHPINLGDISIDDTIIEDGRPTETEKLPPNVTITEKNQNSNPSKKTAVDETRAPITRVEPKSTVPVEAEKSTVKKQTEVKEDHIAALPPKVKKVTKSEKSIEWVKPERPMIAIILDDVGVNKRAAELAIELPSAITLAFMTYADGVQEMAAKAQRKGHELMLHVPMEPLGTADPGPKALLTNLSDEEIRSRLQWGMAQFDGYIGINNHMGSKFTGWRPGMEVVMTEIQKTDHFFLDSRTSPRSVAASIAEAMDVPVLRRDVFIDNDYKNNLEILKQLKKAERIAEKNGHAIAIGHPHRSTVEVLHKWIPEAEGRGFDIVPISRIMTLRRLSGQ